MTINPYSSPINNTFFRSETHIPLNTNVHKVVRFSFHILLWSDNSNWGLRTLTHYVPRVLFIPHSDQTLPIEKKICINIIN